MTKHRKEMFARNVDEPKENNLFPLKKEEQQAAIIVGQRK